MCQMVCFYRTVWEVALERVWKRVLEKYLSGDWLNHLPVSIYHGLTSICQINEAYDIGGVGGKSNLCSRK